MRPSRRGSAPSTLRPGGRYNVEAISRTARLLGQFTRRAPTHSVESLAASTGISANLIDRSLATLQAHGLIRVADGPGDSYALGFTWLQYADVRRQQFKLRFIVLPIMRRMRDAVNETVILAIQNGERRVNIEYLESTQTIRRLTQLGFEVPLHVGATGRALLSGLSPEEVKDYLRRADLQNSPGPSATRIAQDVEDVRARGYAIAFREITSDTAAVAAPIKDHSGHVVAALTVSCPEERFDKALERKCIKCVLAGAAEVSRALGSSTRGDH
jgi:DNA-binding IclR family transcriptional regulator